MCQDSLGPKSARCEPEQGQNWVRSWLDVVQHLLFRAPLALSETLLRHFTGRGEGDDIPSSRARNSHPGRLSQEPTRTSYSPIDCVSAPRTLSLPFSLTLFSFPSPSLSSLLFLYSCLHSSLMTDMFTYCAYLLPFSTWSIFVVFMDRDDQ